MAITEFDFEQIFANEKIAFLSTYNKETRRINKNVISWIQGASPTVLRFAVSTKSEIVSNIETHPSVSFSFFYDKKIVAFQADASIVTKQMADVPFPLTLIELETKQLEDIMFYGAEISQEPVFEKTYNLAAAKKLDGQVYASMALPYDKRD